MVASSLSRKCIQCDQQYAACLKVGAGMFEASHSNFQWIRLKSISSARTRQFRSAHILCHAVAVDDGFALDESTPWFLFIRGGAPWFYHFGFMVRMSHILYHVSMPNCLTNKHNSGVPCRSDIEIDEYP
jgi:hypothetical protein